MLRRTTQFWTLFIPCVTTELCIILELLFTQFALVFFYIAVFYPVGLQVSNIRVFVVTIGAFM